MGQGRRARTTWHRRTRTATLLLLPLAGCGCGKGDDDAAAPEDAPPPQRAERVATPRAATPPSSEESKPSSARPETALVDLAAPPVPNPGQPDFSVGSFEGLLLDDETGEPVLEVLIRHMPGDPPDAWDEEAWDDARARNSRSTGGEWGLPFLRDGTHAVRFDAVGYEPKVLKAEIPVPKDFFLEVRLTRGRWVHGHVRDARGQPVERMELTLTAEPLPGNRPLRPQVIETDASGHYHFTGLPPGDLTIEVTGLEGVVGELPKQELSLASGEEQELDFSLPELTRLSIQIELTGRLMRTDYFATLTNRRGRLVTTEVDAEDVAHFPFVEPGFYDLAIGRRNKDPWSVEQVEIPDAAELVRWERTVEIPPPQHERLKLGRGRKPKGKRQKDR